MYFCHQVDVGLAHFARGHPVGHAGRRTVSDEDFEVIGALGQGDVGCQGACRWHPRSTPWQPAQRSK